MLHFGIAVAASPVLAAGAAVDVVIVVVVYAAGVVRALLSVAAVRGVHLLRFIHGDPRCRRRQRRRRRPRGRRKSTQILTRLDRDSCCRHSIHLGNANSFARFAQSLDDECFLWCDNE